MPWYLAPSLDQLRAEVNARWPKRSKRSDGTIGDEAHSARKSDHNPNRRGSVNAIDITADGIVTAALIAAAKKHPSTHYIIHNGQIMTHNKGNFKPRPYKRGNPHKTHVHISIHQTRAAEQNRRAWGIAAASTKPKPKPKPKTGKAPEFPLKPGHWYGPESRDHRNHSGYYARDRPGIRQLQQRLKDRGWRISVDGRYGTATRDVVRAFQREKRLRVDGAVGAQTWAALWESPIT